MGLFKSFDGQSNTSGAHCREIVARNHEGARCDEFNVVFFPMHWQEHGRFGRSFPKRERKAPDALLEFTRNSSVVLHHLNLNMSPFTLLFKFVPDAVPVGSNLLRLWSTG